VANPASVNFNDLSARIEQGQRQTVVRTFILSFSTVAAAAVVLFFTLRQIFYSASFAMVGRSVC
jgi:preprotein translocase subunit SecF